jgi:hypothetical protein
VLGVQILIEFKIKTLKKFITMFVFSLDFQKIKKIGAIDKSTKILVHFMGTSQDRVMCGYSIKNGIGLANYSRDLPIQKLNILKICFG